MSRKHSIILTPLACLLTAIGCMDIPEPALCSNGLLCPPGMYCAATQDVCTASPCGNAILDIHAGEMCDDGNLDSGDGCSPQCTVERSCGASDTPCQIGENMAVGGSHTCAILDDGLVRCWGLGAYGQLGYGSINNIGDDETLATAGNVDIGHAVIQLTAGASHTCALLDIGSVRCWGLGTYGRLGYGNTNNIGDSEVPASAGSVDAGGNVAQLAAGFGHTCALLDNGAVRCWGAGSYGRLGYGNTYHIGDDETPASAGDVDVGAGTVIQLTAGSAHTCALFDTGAVRCWGLGSHGQLGYGNTVEIGDNEAPASAGNVDVGGTVIQLATGSAHTCALLDTGAVRCWGRGTYGQLGYRSTNNIGDDESPSSAGNVDVGGTVMQLAAGLSHTCALLDTGTVRCWGWGEYGQLGYSRTSNIGDGEVPASAGDVDIGGTVVRLAAGGGHTCALLDSGALRCWGRGIYGQLGYGGTNNIGDDETPASAANISVSSPIF